MRKKTVLIVDDEKLIRWSLRQKLEEWNFQVMEAEDSENGMRILEEEMPDLLMLDVKLPDKKGTDVLKDIKKEWPQLPVIMITAYGIIDDAVLAMRRGAFDFITKPVDYPKLENTIRHALESADLKKEISYYREKEKKQNEPIQVIARSSSMKKILLMAEKIAKSEASIILLQGESGSGKDLMAQNIHRLSRRGSSPYLAINCSAIPENLLESELFGYEKGAFTDAKSQKQGLVEMADEGTLFLDEISTLSLHLQAKLLRFLETHTFKRVGGLKDIEVDLRVITATNQDLEKACEEGKFRKDLYFRLNVCPLFIPPLRQRKEDILPLTQHFIKNYNQKFRKNIKGLQKEAEDLFIEYRWPGNVRELKNAIERAMIFEEDSFISTEYIPFGQKKTAHSFSNGLKETLDSEILSLPEAEKQLLIMALKKSNGNKSEAARLLNVTRDKLRYMIKKHRIEYSYPN